MKKIDLEKLSKEFGIDEEELEGLGDNDQSSEYSEQQLPPEQENMPEGEEVDLDDPERILEENIRKANRVLDKILLEMGKGMFTARMAEVAGQLVNAVTNAVDKVFARDAGVKNLLIKDKMLGLKEKEANIKEKLFEARQGGKKQKELVVTDRETILNLLEKEEEKEEPDDNG